MSSAFKFGELSVSIFGESHGKAIGVVIDGLPGGIGIDFDAVLDFMARRAPKKDGTSTMRSENGGRCADRHSPLRCDTEYRSAFG